MLKAIAGKIRDDTSILRTCPFDTVLPDSIKAIILPLHFSLSLRATVAKNQKASVICVHPMARLIKNIVIIIIVKQTPKTAKIFLVPFSSMPAIPNARGRRYRAERTRQRSGNRIAADSPPLLLISPTAHTIPAQNTRSRVNEETNEAIPNRECRFFSTAFCFELPSQVGTSAMDTSDSFSMNSPYEPTSSRSDTIQPNSALPCEQNLPHSLTRDALTTQTEI